MRITRRNFIKSSFIVGATVACPLFIPRHVFGANEVINVGVIGLGVRGHGSHLPEFSALPNVRIVALADPDQARTQAAAQWLDTKGFPHAVEQYEDMRRIFERNDVQAVSVATMNYWHGLATIWACEAGKHVYCEKPLSHFIWEGRQMVNAARKYDRVVQHGTQLRAMPGARDAIQWIKEGNLGKIQCVTAFANKPRTSIGNRSEPLPLPSGFNYDLWCGPAQDGPIYRDQLQYDCSFTWNMGDGESLNQGVHQLDVARWLLDIEDMPRRVCSMGGRFLFNDQGDVPNTQIVYYDYPQVPLLYEVHNLRVAKGSNEVEKFRGFSQTGVVVDCEGGWVGFDHGNRATAFDRENKPIKNWNENGNIFQNFVDVIRSGKKEDLHADILCGHLSTRIGHTGNISYRLGAKSTVTEQKKAVEGYPYFAAMHDKYLQHLQAHEIEASETILGPWLECNTETESFINNEAANQLVRGTYRSPYHF